MAARSGWSPRSVAAAPSTSRCPTKLVAIPPASNSVSRVTSAALTPDWSLEEELWRRNVGLVAGIDEAGRGALAGPVVAAAVILPPGEEHPFRDSKTLNAAQRELLAEAVRGVALAYAVGVASALEVDSLNVLG